MPQKELFILDVGHGNCTVFKDNDGIVLVDAGPGSTLLEFLSEEEINKIDVVLISHADKDHIEGLIAVIDAKVVEFGKIRLNSDASKGTKLWDDLLHSLEDLSRRSNVNVAVSLTTGNSHEFNQGDVDIEILSPNIYIAGKSAGSKDSKNRTLTSNSNSAVIRLVVNGEPIVLLPADVDSVGFDNLVEDGYDCNASIVIFPHHGGNPGTGDAVKFAEEFCTRAKPKILIFSLGRGIHGTPRPEIIEAVKRVVPDVKIICTQLSENCAVEIPTTAGGHLTPKFAKGKQKGHCCAGTISINLDDFENSIAPFLADHEEFITNLVPGALCRIS